MPTRLIDSLGVTAEYAALFDDDAVLNGMLRFEVALARAQARLGLIPNSAAEAIAQITGLDPASLAKEARHHATLALPFVNHLKGRVPQAAAEFVHWGATSQDLLDTALVLMIRDAQTVLARDHQRLAAALRKLSEEHAGTPLLARTLLQPAPPITFGYKVAAWCAAVERNWARLEAALREGLILQFGGAAGTLASYGNHGLALTAELARELQLPAPAAPWHTHRDRLAAVVANCGIYTATLGKIARDISLHMQFEVGELSEAAAGGRSSAMPHKRNPAGCTLVLAAATRMPSLVSSYLTGMIQEHERATGGLQAEWQTVSQTIETTGSSLTLMANTIEGLTVNADRMRANIDSTHGAIYSEPAAAKLGPDVQPEDYLGSAETFRRQLLKESD